MILVSALWRHEIWLRRLILVLLASLAAYLSAAIFWSFSTAVEPELPAIQSTDTTQTKAIPTTSPDLFGAIQVDTPSKQPAQKTRLKLTLKGVIPAAEMENSLAIVTSRGNKDDVYQVGDSIIAGVTLQAVYPDHIILKRGDKVESLFFAEDNLLTLVESKTETKVVEPLKLNELKGDIALSAKELNEDKLFNSMGLQPTGNAYEVLDSSALLNFGLKAGDKIVAINGLSAGRIQHEQNLNKVMRQQDVALFQILRGSRSFSISYPIN